MLEKLVITEEEKVQINQTIFFRIGNKENEDSFVPHQLTLGHTELNESLEKILLDMRVGESCCVLKSTPNLI